MRRLSKLFVCTQSNGADVSHADIASTAGMQIHRKVTSGFIEAVKSGLSKTGARCMGNSQRGKMNKELKIKMRALNALLRQSRFIKDAKKTGVLKFGEGRKKK